MDYKKEIVPLIMISTEAYRVQNPCLPYDAWRREEVQAAVGRAGLSECNHEHFGELMGHFHAAAHRDIEALRWYRRAPKNTELQIAWSIVNLINKHLALATASEATITSTVPPRQRKRLLAAREAILAHPEGPIDYNYLIALAMDKTKRPRLTLDPENLAASLADRCTQVQLVNIRYTIVNRIAAREGRGNTADRNKSQKSPEAKEARSPHTLAIRPGTELF